MQRAGHLEDQFRVSLVSDGSALIPSAVSH